MNYSGVTLVGTGPKAGKLALGLVSSVLGAISFPSGGLTVAIVVKELQSNVKI